MTEACCAEAAFLVLMNHWDHEEVVETALAVLANFSEEVECSERLGSQGVCEVVASATFTHGVASVDLAMLGCRAIGNLARENRDNTTRLENALAYEVTPLPLTRYYSYISSDLALSRCCAGDRPSHSFLFRSPVPSPSRLHGPRPPLLRHNLLHAAGGDTLSTGDKEPATSVLPHQSCNT